MFWGKGTRVRLTNGKTKGTVMLRTKIEGRIALLVQWDNGNEPSFERAADLELLNDC